FRVAITPELLRPYLANKRVVELGCGSGIMAGKLIEYGAASYLGIDIAKSAVETARARYGDNPKVRSSVAEMPPPFGCPGHFARIVRLAHGRRNYRFVPQVRLCRLSPRHCRTAARDPAVASSLLCPARIWISYQ